MGDENSKGYAKEFVCVCVLYPEVQKVWEMLIASAVSGYTNPVFDQRKDAEATE